MHWGIIKQLREEQVTEQRDPCRRKLASAICYSPVMEERTAVYKHEGHKSSIPISSIVACRDAGVDLSVLSCRGCARMQGLIDLRAYG
jgi:hypothetical protein